MTPESHCTSFEGDLYAPLLATSDLHSQHLHTAFLLLCQLQNLMSSRFATEGFDHGTFLWPGLLVPIKKLGVGKNNIQDYGSYIPTKQLRAIYGFVF